MKILLLSPYGSNIAKTIEAAGDVLVDKIVKISPSGIEPVPINADMIVMFGHRQILKGFMPEWQHRIVNVHPSLLPWNRGAHCNFWSWYDDSPKGVSVLFADEGIDTGDIIASEQVYSNVEHETLRTTYNHLQETAEKLFERMWPTIRQGTTGLRQDHRHGSSHKKKDIERIWPNLSLGWDSPISEVVHLGQLARNKVA